MTPPPLPAQPVKKKSGCLKPMLITFAVLAVLMVMGAISQKQTEAKWQENRELVLAQMKVALESGKAQEALNLARDYKTINDADLKKLMSDAQRILGEKRKEADGKRKIETKRRAKELAETEANKPLATKIKDKLHREMGSKKEMFSDEWHWDALRNADYYPDQKLASVSYNLTSSFDQIVYERISQVIECILKFEEVDTVTVQAFTEYMDVDGNKAMLPKFNVTLTRDAASKANWENLRSNHKVEQFLRQRGEVRVRGE